MDENARNLENAVLVTLPTGIVLDENGDVIEVFHQNSPGWSGEAAVNPPSMVKHCPVTKLA